MALIVTALRRIIPAFGLLSLIALTISCQTSSVSKEPIPLSSYDQKVGVLVAQMTLEEKVGQMIQPDYINLEDISDIATYHLGSVLCGGSSDPTEGNSLESWTDTYDRVQDVATSTRLGIPLIFGIDAVHGHNNVLGAVIFPHNIGLGCANNPDLVEQIGRITAIEMRATGIQWTFAPCVTVVRDERWGRTYEGFSEEPGIASVLGAAAVRGLQGADMSDPLAVAACAKHYIADGGTTAQVMDMSRFRMPGAPPAGSNNFGGVAQATRGGTRVSLNAGNAEMDEATLRSIHLPPYRAAVEAGAATIMPSYSSWNGVKCSGNKYLLTDVLKDELGFEGFLISDYSAIGQLDREYKTAVAMAINAGMDMGMVPNRYQEFYHTLIELVEEGTVPMERIDDAVTRILRVKCALGLLDKDCSPLADRSLHKQFGSDEHRAVARDAVRQSLVLLKNEGVLPIAKDTARIHVAGSSADNLGNQCGGWTVEWQGRSGEVTTGGTTILAAIRNTVSSGTEVTYSLDGAGAAGANVGLLVVGETPYAEGSGDNGDLTLRDADLAAYNAMTEAGIPVVVVLISGRPMIVTDIIEGADAFVAAWLPGTEGQGIADVMFGDYAPTGKLSFSWPRSIDQLPLNIGDTGYDPLFAYGFGLTY